MKSGADFELKCKILIRSARKKLVLIIIRASCKIAPKTAKYSGTKKLICISHTYINPININNIIF